MAARRLVKPSTRVKDAGIAIRHSQGRILFYTAGSKNELAAVGRAGKSINLSQKSLKSVFDPKVESSKMGLSITPRGCGSGPTLFRNIWPR